MGSNAGGKSRGKLGCLVQVFLCLVWVWASVLVSAERGLEESGLEKSEGDLELWSFLWPQPKGFKYHHSWPTLKIGWSLLLGSIVVFLGAALGSVGGVGGGAVFVPMLTIIIGFDVKSSTALSKCMITGIAAVAVFNKLKMRHPTLDMAVIDYDLALLCQPMLLLGTTIGVYLNVIFPKWMIILLLVILSLGTANKAFYSAFNTWRKETLIMRKTASVDSSDDFEATSQLLLIPSSGANQEEIVFNDEKVPFVQNIRWKELGLLMFVWFTFLVIQIEKNNDRTCSTKYWVLNFLQVPVALGATLFESIRLYRGGRKISCKRGHEINWSIRQLIFYSICGIFAGITGGLLGLGSSFILAPLFLQLGLPSQVAGATASFVMAFSSPLSVVQYYLLKRFPPSAAMYFVAVVTLAAFVGQRFVRGLILLLGRASLTISILAFLIAVSTISLGVHGIIDFIASIQHEDYIGFDDRCLY